MAMTDGCEESGFMASVVQLTMVVLCGTDRFGITKRTRFVYAVAPTHCVFSEGCVEGIDVNGWPSRWRTTLTGTTGQVHRPCSNVHALNERNTKETMHTCSMMSCMRKCTYSCIHMHRSEVRLLILDVQVLHTYM